MDKSQLVPSLGSVEDPYRRASSSSEGHSQACVEEVGRLDLGRHVSVCGNVEVRLVVVLKTLAVVAVFAASLTAAPNCGEKGKTNIRNVSFSSYILTNLHIRFSLCKGSHCPAQRI